MNCSKPAATPHNDDPARAVVAVLRSSGPLTYVIAALALFAALTPATFLTQENFKAILDQATVPLILISGLTFVILIGSIDLSLEGVMAASSLTFVLLSENSRNSNKFQILSIVAAIGVGVIFGLLNGLIHARLKIPSFMVSLGVWFVGLGVGTILYGNDMPIYSDAAVRDWISASHFGVSNAAVVSIVCVSIAFLIGRRAKLGRYAYAIGASEDISRLNGIPVVRYKVYVFVLSGFCAALAAVISSARLGVGTADVGSGQLFFTIASVIVGGTFLSGGRGGVLHSVCGVLLLVVVNNGLIHIGASPIMQQALAGLVIVAAVVVTGIRERSKLRVVK